MSRLSRWALVPALLGVSGPASAQLVLAPPVLGKELKPPASAIERAIQEELEKLAVPPVKRTKHTTQRLAKCGNKMSCLSDVGKRTGASHVLHTIVAQRGEEVLAQLTILDVSTGKPLEATRSKSTPALEDIDRGIREAARTVGQTLRKLPQFAGPSSTPGPVALGAPIKLPPPVDTGTPPIGTAPAPSPSTEESFGPSARPTTTKPWPKADPSPPPAAASVASLEPSSPSTPSTGGGAGGYFKWGTGALGVAAAAGGVVAMVLAHGDANLRDETPQVDQARRVQLDDSAVGKQSVGLGLLIGGGVAVGASVIWFLLDGGKSSSAAGLPTGGAPTLALDW